MNSCQVKSRLLFIIFIFFIFYGVIVANLYRIQIKHHDFYTGLGKHQYNETITQVPPRAYIFDRNGICLANNKNSFSAFLLPKQCKNFDNVKAFIAKNFPEAIERINSQQSCNFTYIKRKLTDEEIEKIKTSGQSDIHILTEPHRFYSSPACASIIGLTDIDNKGILGLEWKYDSLLSGKPTTYFLKRDARLGHFYFQKETVQKGIDGKPIKLTIDSALQFLVVEELQETLNRFEAKEGSVIVINPKSGDILAMVSLPTFDPNNTFQLNIEHTKNKAISERYELGSVIKVFAALAAIEEKVVTNDELIDCQNKRTAYVDGRKINTVKAHGIIPFAEVIARSNNIGTTTVIKRLDKKLYDHYIRLGFTSKTDIALPGEQSGFVTHPNNWSKQSIFSLAYGYEVAITLIELARAFCIIAQDGNFTQPQLIKKPKEEIVVYSEQKSLYSQQSIDSIKDILEQTTIYGTARRAAIKGYRIMSKTGTANILENGKYVQHKNIFTCAGIVQKEDYKRVIVVFIKEATRKNLFAATVAAPLFERIAEKTIIHDKVV